MQRIVLLLCLITLLFGSAPAFAQAEQDPFVSWLTLVDYMRSKGMEPSRINWGPIDPMCIGLKKDSDEWNYNKCKYEKARDSVMFDSDQAMCNLRARAAFPNTLKSPARTETINEIDKNGIVRSYDRISGTVGSGDLKALRQSTFMECMRSMGWVSADDWRMGRECQK